MVSPVYFPGISFESTQWYPRVNPKDRIESRTTKASRKKQQAGYRLACDDLLGYWFECDSVRNQASHPRGETI